MCLRALRNEFVLRRGLFLRVYPLAYDVDGIDYGAILNEEGYTAALEEVPQRTFLLDLGLPLADIRMNFDHKWRNCLSKAERNELEYVEGTGDALFADFMHLYRALLDRKKFKEPSDIAEFRAIQQQLPDDQKMMLFLTGKNGTVSCGAICTALGRTGVYLFGACNDQGLTTNGSYLIQWKIIQWLKQQGCLHYNLNGINPEKNPGTYHFKAGVAGKARREVRYLGRFDAYAGSPTATGVHVMNAALLRCKSMLRQASGPGMRDHLSVCVCTYRRNDMLRRLLFTLSRQETQSVFDYSIVVIDNDARGPAKECVDQAREDLGLDIVYDIEPTNTIPAARNHALRLAKGNFIGIIDDDEIAPADWLITMYRAINTFAVDGALGPVYPFFENTPPAWLVKSGLCERPVIRTGTLLRWDDTRTGNVLLRKDVFTTNNLYFDENCKTSGSDKEFFREAMDRGCRFVAVKEAPVFETVPPERQTKSYYFRRYRIQASNERKFRAPMLRGLSSVTAPMKALVALSAYGLALPLSAVFGTHHTIRLALKAVYHGSWLLTMIGFDLAKSRDL